MKSIRRSVKDRLELCLGAMTTKKGNMSQLRFLKTKRDSINKD